MSAAASRSMAGLSVQGQGVRSVARTLPEEVPVAMVFNGTTAAVMMATPGDLRDFAVGFALSEGIIGDPGHVESLEIVAHDTGFEARFWLVEDRASALEARRRSMTGPVGCGLCGIDSLEQALRPLPVLDVAHVTLSAAEAAGATEALRAHQPLHDLTHGVHGAGFLLPGQGIVLTREDVGRHNALDKLIGAMARGGIAPWQGAIVLTSRVSVDMVQKAVMAGCGILIAVSAPTAHALRLARQSGLTVAAFAREGGFDIYSHPERLITGAPDAA